MIDIYNVYLWNGTTYDSSGTYYYSEGDGCPQNDSLVLTINPLPVVSAGGDQTVCSGLDATLISILVYLIDYILLLRVVTVQLHLI